MTSGATDNRTVSRRRAAPRFQRLEAADVLPPAWRRIIGAPPARVPPAVETLSRVDCGGHVRELIAYDVGAAERIRAFVCIPSRGQPPYPAVFCHHQHGGDHLLGKSEVVGIHGSEDQRYASELADRGFVTIAPDLPCFEDRADASDPRGNHWFAAASCLIGGTTLLAKVLHEVSLAIDILCARSDVDDRRIGFIGHSYGGRTAFFAAADDQRIAATVSSCGSTALRTMIDQAYGVQPDFVVPGLLAVGDIADLLPCIAPRPLLVLAAKDDRWSQDLDALRSALGTSPASRVVTFAGTHSFPAEMRATAYRFLDHHLKPAHDEA